VAEAGQRGSVGVSRPGYGKPCQAEPRPSAPRFRPAPRGRLTTWVTLTRHPVRAPPDCQRALMAPSATPIIGRSGLKLSP